MNENLRKIFDHISSRYESVNHIMTGGVDILWRRKLAKIAVRGGGSVWLDLCTGTGEVAELLKREARPETKVFVADFSEFMLLKARSKKLLVDIPMVLTDAFKLPFKNESLDLITVSLAIRNLDSDTRGLLNAFLEFSRVLKQGGRFVCLETSQPGWLCRRITHCYVKYLVSPLGHLFSNNDVGYKYLASSILSFFDAESLRQIILSTGFSSVTYKRLFFGVAAIHKAVK